MRLVVYGAASAPKFTTLSPPQGRLGRPAAPPPGQSAAAARVLARRACNLDARPLAPAKCSRGCSATTKSVPAFTSALATTMSAPAFTTALSATA